MIYEVDERVLREYKSFCEKYSRHDKDCSYYTLEVCDCGYSSDISSLHVMCKNLIKEKEKYGKNQY